MYRPLYTVTHIELGEDKSILGIFSSKLKAENYIEKLLKETFLVGKKQRPKYRSKDFEIERWNLNEGKW
jgi:hypothetical protein